MRFLVIKRNGILRILAIAIIAVACLTAVGLTDSAKVFSGETTRKSPICSVDTGEKKVVALSFDASWGAEQTAAIIETLNKFDARATYFVVGAWAEKHASELKMLSESDRIEIGTHSNTHPHMPKLSQKQAELELSTSKAIIEAGIGKKVELFRAPYGEYSDMVLSAAEKQGLITVQWSVDSLDWQDTPAADIAKRVLTKIDNGGIVLLHNDGKHTLAALPAIIEGLKNKGYTFQTVGEMIHRDGYTIQKDGKQIKRG